MTIEEAKDYIREWCPYDRQEEIIKALEQEPCEDCISRKNTLKAMIEKLGIRNEDYLLPAEATLYKVVKNMPPVTPQQKIGYWIKTPKAVMGEGYMWYCDKCEHQVYQDSSRPYPSEKYCPNCGCRKIEPTKSETEQSLSYADQDTLMSAT